MHKIFNQFRSEESIFIDEPKQFSRIKVPLHKISKKEFYILLVSLLNSATFYTQKSLLEVNPILMIKFFNKLDSRIFLSIETQEYNLFSILFSNIHVFCLVFCTFSPLFSLYSRILPRFLYTFFISIALDAILLFRILLEGS